VSVAREHTFYRQMVGQPFHMDPKTLVIQYLDEAHATETALVTNLTAHIAMTTDSQYERILRRHLDETRAQVENIEQRRAELGKDGGRGVVAVTVGLARDAVGQALVLSKGPLDAIRTPDQRERMLKNAKDECATEALEIATYDALEAAAKAAGDTKTAKLAADHRKQEERMLADLRKQITRLATQTYESKTGEKAKASVKSRTSTSSRTGSTTRKSSRSSSSRTSGTGSRRKATSKS
jgi:ferritin-like metal-binding protein YciE